VDLHRTAAGERRVDGRAVMVHQEPAAVTALEEVGRLHLGRHCSALR
jgi:hypothetical protein